VGCSYDHAKATFAILRKEGKIKVSRQIGMTHYYIWNATPRKISHKSPLSASTAAKIVAQIDGTTDITEFSNRVGLSRESVYNYLRALAAAGAITIRAGVYVLLDAGKAEFLPVQYDKGALRKLREIDMTQRMAAVTR
jgi:predicted transcriptional regulator